MTAPAPRPPADATGAPAFEAATLNLAEVRWPLGADLLATALAPPTDGQAPAWTVEPLGAADGELRGRITDAQWLFDADVTVPVRGGRVDFDDAAVAHVGPDSRLGVSRMGIYVDAPNGRQYLLQFAAVPTAGVAFERRGALLGAWVADRGALALREVAESLLRQAAARIGGLTDAARALVGRTALQGELQLSDGWLRGPGLAARFVMRSDGDNRVRLDGPAGQPWTVAIPSLSLADVDVAQGPARLQAAGLRGAVRIAVDPRAPDAPVLHVERLVATAVRVTRG